MSAQAMALRARIILAGLARRRSIPPTSGASLGCGEPGADKVVQQIANQGCIGLVERPCGVGGRHPASPAQLIKQELALSGFEPPPFDSHSEHHFIGQHVPRSATLANTLGQPLDGATTFAVTVETERVEQSVNDPVLVAALGA